MSYYENRIKALEEKVAEMAKRERMKAIPVEAQLLDSLARLKAEVASLKSLCDNLGMGGKHTVTAIVEENARLKAEVERLRKAGDAMADAIYEADQEKLEAHKKFKLTNEEYNAVQLWLAAKEGKPSV